MTAQDYDVSLSSQCQKAIDTIGIRFITFINLSIIISLQYNNMDRYQIMNVVNTILVG